MFLHGNFLGIPPDENTFEKSRVAILSVPNQRTVSYGTGTRNGLASGYAFFPEKVRRPILPPGREARTQEAGVR